MNSGFFDVIHIIERYFIPSLDINDYVSYIAIHAMPVFERRQRLYNNWFVNVTV